MREPDQHAKKSKGWRNVADIVATTCLDGLVVGAGEPG
jgi:hypothetical protein